MPKHNQPSSPTHPPQHILTEEDLPPGGDTDRTAWKHNETSADPHPSDDGHPDRVPHPGGSHPPQESRDIGPNPYVHDGTAPPRPRNVTNTR